MPAVDLHPDVVRAIQRVSKTPLGRRYDRFARRRYGVSGPTLAGKTVAGEFGGRSTATGRGVVSSAGARGPAQFIKSTRDLYVQRHGVDPWKDDVSAIKGMALHHLATGVEGYNPGMPTYKDYILGQRLRGDDLRALRSGSTQPGSGGTLGLEGPTRTRVGLGDPKVIPGQSFAAERRDARMSLLMDGGLNLQKLLEYKSSINSLKDVPARIEPGDLEVQRTQAPGVNVPTRSGGAGRPGSWAGKNDVAELYFDPGINVDEGRKTGAIGDHGGHVHFASRDPRAILYAGRLAKQMGLRVGENPKWDPVDPVHTGGSFHYRRFDRRPNLGQAIDVSGDPSKLAVYNRRLARTFGIS